MSRIRRFYRVWLMAGACALWLVACANRPATSTPAAVAAGSPTPALQMRTFEALWSAVDESYLYKDFGGVNWQAVREEYRARVEADPSADEFADLMRAMLAELPDGTAIWQTRAERIEQEAQDASRYEGIGAFVSFRAEPAPRVVLLAVMPGSPAEKAGLRAHDSILAVDGVDVSVEEGAGAVARVRGPAGSDVKLRVQTPGRAPRDVVVTRGSLSAVDTLKGGAVPNSAIGYMLFPVTSSDVLLENVIGGLQSLSEEGELKGLILDLRIASAGSGWPLIGMMTLFSNGNLGEVYTRSETQPIIVAGQNISNSQSVPLTILVGPDTDGAPEIFAAALQATGRATLVGLPTPGLVEALDEFPLPDGSLAFIVASTYRTSIGRDIGQVGIEPDIVVESDWDAVTAAEDPVVDVAIEVLRSLAR